MPLARRAIVAACLTAALVCALLPAPTARAGSPATAGSAPALTDQTWSADVAPVDPLAIAAGERTSPASGARLPALAGPLPPLSLADSWTRHDTPDHARPAWRSPARAPEFARPPPASTV